jgi:lipoate synthase
MLDVECFPVNLFSMTVTEPKRPRLPEWLRITLPTSDSFARTRGLLDELKLHTVCESAKCPNHWECWSKGTATFMIAGDRCTRACGFCAVSTAKPLALEADARGESAHLQSQFGNGAAFDAERASSRDV